MSAHSWPTWQANAPSSDADDDAAVLDAALRDGLRPDPVLTVSAWADEHRILSGRTASERGRWRTDRAPYLREPFDLLSATSSTLRVVVKKASQMGFTEGAVNWLGYTIQHAPGPFLFVEPTVEVGKRLSRQKIDTAIAESPALRARVAGPRSRDSANTMALKEFPGGLVVITGANSSAGLCYASCRYLVLDDVDRYPRDVDGEGDPIALAQARAHTFGARRKELMLSSPTVAGFSRIDREWEVTDRRRYFVPCPACGAMQPLDFPNLKWAPGDFKSVRYECVACHALIREASKTAMLARGEWRATATADDPTTAGFQISALYCPVGWLSWADIANAAEKAARDPQRQKAFANTILGETYAAPSEAPDWLRLRERSSAHAIGTVPWGGLFLTGGVDVQRDRLECSVWGWGRGKRSWLVDHQILEGDVATEGPWAALTALVARTWPAADGRLALPLTRVAVDTGFATAAVHTWARTQPAGRVVLVRGGKPGAALVALPRSAEAVETTGRVRRRRRSGLRVWTVNVDALRTELHGWLRLDAPAPGLPTPAGWISIPAVGDEFLRQLVAHALVRRTVRGVERLEWTNVHRRDEAADCRVYARAAAHLVGLDRFTDDDWARLDEPFAALRPPPPPGSPSDPSPPASSPPDPDAPPVVPPVGGAPTDVTWRRSRYW